MRYLRIIGIACLLVMVLAACGRRLEVTPIPTADASAETESTLTLASLLDDPASIGDPSDTRVAAVLDADPQLGETLFNVNTTNATCSSCHAANSDQRLVGPGMLGLPQRADERVAGESVVEYIYNSIADPNAHIVEGYPEGVMPQTYIDQYSDAQMNSLVAYLVTLQEDGALLEQLADADETSDAAADTADEGEAIAQAATQTPYVIVVTATPEAATPTAVPPTSTPLPSATPVIVAVQATEGPSPTPDRIARIAEFGVPAYGADLFEANCASCHAVDSVEMGDDGPGLLGIPQKAAQAPGQSAAAYIFNSIVSGDVHSTDFDDELTQAQLYDLTAYLLTLNADTVTREGEAVTAREVPPTPTLGAAESTDDAAADGDADNPIVVAVGEADAANGEMLWSMIEGGSPCSTCHYVDQDAALVGPGMLGIPQRAADRTDDPAAVYLYNSIVAPNEYLVEGYPEGVMPMNYGDLLTDEQLYDIVAYLLTLDE